MVDCLRDQQDPTGSSPGFQARLKPRLETRRLAGGMSWSRRQSTMDSLNHKQLIRRISHNRTCILAIMINHKQLIRRISHNRTCILAIMINHKQLIRRISHNRTCILAIMINHKQLIRRISHKLIYWIFNSYIWNWIAYINVYVGIICTLIPNTVHVSVSLSTTNE